MRSQTITQVGLFTAVTIVLSWIPPIPLPFSPVPITLQVFAVLLSGAVLGAKKGALSQIVYWFLGAIGLPVFSGGTGGLGVVFGPTGGYLIGFIAAAFVLGTLISLGEKPDASRAILYATAVAASLFCVYLPGTLWLAHYLGISIPAAAGIATLPYIPLDLVKALLAVSLALPIRRRLKTAVR